MAITQDRLLRLLTAAEQYQLLIQSNEHEIQRIIRNGHNQQANQILSALSDLLLMSQASTPHAANLVLVEERTKYNLTKHRNNWIRERKATQRGRAGQVQSHDKADLEAYAQDRGPAGPKSLSLNSPGINTPEAQRFAQLEAEANQQDESGLDADWLGPSAPNQIYQPRPDLVPTSIRDAIRKQAELDAKDILGED